MYRIALGIEYDGGSFEGWQSQPSGKTVQDAVETAAGRFLGQSQRVAISAAGRTDAGVHALGQVIHLDAPCERDMHAWTRGMNALLPNSIAVRWAHRVPESFHARFCAMSRSYVYRILNDSVRSPMFDGRAAWCFRPLDVSAMQRAAACLVGEHDFSSFRSAECQAKSPRKRVASVDIRRIGRTIEFAITADAFLHHMVRNIVGSLVYVGLGRRPVDWIDTLLQVRDRSQAAPTYPACGLYFLRAEYPIEFELPTIERGFPAFQWDAPFVDLPKTGASR